MASLRIFGREIEMKMIMAMMIFALFAVLATGAYLFGSGITGFAIFTIQHNHTDTVSLEFNESGEYEWNLENIGDVRSIKLDGSKNNSGTAKVYIEKDGVRYLIFDSTQLVKKESGLYGITGFAVKEKKKKQNEVKAEVDGALEEQEQELLDSLVDEINHTGNNVKISITWDPKKKKASEKLKTQVKQNITSIQEELVEEIAENLKSYDEKVKISVESSFKKEKKKDKKKDKDDEQDDSEEDDNETDDDDGTDENQTDENETEENTDEGNQTEADEQENDENNQTETDNDQNESDNGQDDNQESDNDEDSQNETEEPNDDAVDDNDNGGNETEQDEQESDDEQSQEEGENEGQNQDDNSDSNNDEEQQEDEQDGNETEEDIDEEENNAPVWDSDTDSFAINSETAIDLNDYYNDADNDSLAFSSSNVENVSITIEDGVATLDPDDGIEAARLATFAAYDGINITYKQVSLIVSTPVSNETANETANETEEIIDEVEGDIEVELEYGSYEGYDVNNDGIEDFTGVIDFSVANTRFNLDVNEDNLCTRYEVYSEDNEESTLLCHGSADCCSIVELANSRDEWNETLFLTYGSYSASEENIVFAQVLHADYNLTGENPYFNVTYSEWANLTASFENGIIEFEDVCEDSCLLSGFNSSQYKLIIEVNNTRLTIEGIDYVIEEKIANDAPVLVSEIGNVSIVEDTNYTIDLSEYFYDADNDTLAYSHFDVDNVTITFENNSAHIMPQSGFSGNRFTYIMANDSYGSVSSNIFKIEVNASGRPKIELGKPVKWKETILVNVTNETLKLTIPETASNITLIAIVNDTATAIQENEIKIIDEGENKTKEVFEKEKELEKVKRKTSLLEEARDDNAVKVVMENEELRNEDIDDKLVELGDEQNDLEDQLNSQGTSGLITGAVVGFAEVQEISSNETVVEINQSVEQITIEYITQAPYAIEKDINSNVKQIKIISEANYTEVLAFTDIQETKQDSINLYWLKDTGREEFTAIDYLDTNLNGLVDRLEWVVPHLSNQTFEVTITVLNVQSYPTVGGNWTVRFNTTGIGNLTIMASNGTSYSELYNDNSSTTDDLVPLSLTCGAYEHYNKDDLINSFNFYIVLENNSRVALADTIGKELITKGVYLEDYSCNATAFWTVKVLTEGVHAQQFNFSNQIAYGNNFASTQGSTSNGSKYQVIDDSDTDFLKGNLSTNLSIEGTGKATNITLAKNDSQVTSLSNSSQFGINASTMAFWQFNDGSGTNVNDLSSNNYDGTTQNSPVWNTTSKFGSHAMTFDADSSQYVNVGDVSGLSFTNHIFTFEAWVYVTDLRERVSILSKANQGGPWEYTMHGINGNIRFDSWTSDGTGVYEPATFSNMYSPGWTYIVWTTDGTNGYIYKNGNMTGMQTKNANSMSDTTAPFKIGRGESGGEVSYMNGTIDELAVWNVRLDNATILDHYNRGVQRHRTGNFTSQVFDANRTVNWTSIRWEGSPDVSDFIAISSGRSYSCGVIRNGSAYCWGSDEASSTHNGKLGYGGTNQQNSPVQVNISANFSKISAGGGHTCGILQNDSAYCWGLGSSGELGTGATTEHHSPTQIDWSQPQNFTSIATGRSHTCGILQNGSAYCWGLGSSGQLGYGGTSNQNSPVQVNISANFSRIAAGNSHTCGILTNGSGYCWGAGSNGKLGYGGDGQQGSPIQVNISANFSTISAGGIHSCGILTNGSGYCWGAGSNGRLGYGGDGQQGSPIQVNISANFSAISAGGFLSCGVLTNGSGYCWGSGSFGMLGNGGTSNQNSPVQVNSSAGFSTVSVGAGSLSDHTCGLLQTGDVQCWGSGDNGKLGYGGALNQNSPIEINSTDIPLSITGLSILTRTSKDNITWSSYSSHISSPSTANALGRYFQYAAVFTTDNTSVTPILNNVSINYSTVTNLSIWDDTDILTRFATQRVMFNANFTDFVNTLNGTNVWCTFSNNATGGWSAASNMSFNSTNGLYYRNLTFASPTTSPSSFNVTCDGTALGYNVVKVLDEFTIYPSLNVSVNLNDSAVLASTQDPVSVFGHINLSNGTNVSNNVVNVYQDGRLLNANITEYYHNRTDDSDTDFNKGNLTNNATVQGTGNAANLTLFINNSQYRNDSNTVLLLHFNGTHESTSFYDDGNGTKTITNVGSALIVTNVTKINASAGFIDGTTGSSNYITAPDSGDWNFDGDFAIEGWFNLQVNDQGWIFGTTNTGAGRKGIRCSMTTTRFSCYAGTTDDLNDIFAMEASQAGLYGLNEWVHLAVVRSGTSAKLYVNGGEVDSATSGTTIPNNGVFNLGRSGVSAGNAFYADEFRISKGVVRYAGNFSPNGHSYSRRGNFTSQAFDAGATANWTALIWQNATPKRTNLTLYTRTSADNITWGAWLQHGTSPSIISASNRYLQYLAVFNTSNVSATPILLNITINYTGLFTDNYGNYNFTFNAPASAGTYTIKVNSTWDSTISGEQSTTLSVIAAPVIQNIYTIPAYPKKDQNVTFYVNVSDADSNILSVNFTLISPNVTQVINNSNGSNNGADQNWNKTFNLTAYGTWRWNVSIYDGSGFIVNSTTQSVILMELTEALNVSITTASNPIAVSGHINLSNGTNVTNERVHIFIDGGEFNITANFTDDTDTDFNKGNLTLNVSVQGTGNAANLTLNASLDGFTHLLLHFNGTDAYTINGSDDNSGRHKYNFSGNAQIDTAQSKFGGSSLLMDGTGDFVNLSDSGDWQLGGGSGGFTLETWIRFAADMNPEIVHQRPDGDNQWVWYIDESAPNDRMNFRVRDGAVDTVFIQNTFTEMPINEWHHIAVVKSSDNYYMFVDGSQIGTTQSDTSTIPDLAATLEIGDEGAGNFMNGWFDEFHISNYSRWTQNFNPFTKEYPLYAQNSNYSIAGGSGNFTSQSFDAGNLVNWTNIKWGQEVPYGKEIGHALEDGINASLPGINTSGLALLLHFNGSDGYSTNSSIDHFQAIPYNFSGNASIETNDSKFGGSSAAFGNGIDYLSVNDSPDWSLGTDDFAMAFWVKFQTVQESNLITQHNGNDQNMQTVFYEHGKKSLEFACAISNDRATCVEARANFTPSDNTWYHIAVVRKNSDGYMYIDGASKPVTTLQGSWGNSFGNYNKALTIGGTDITINSASVETLHGYMDEVAVWKNQSLSADDVLNLYKRGALRLNISTRTSQDNITWSAWSNIYNNNSLSPINSTTGRYLQYKAVFGTEDTSYTPILNNITINYTGLFTNSYGNYNFTFNAPANAGTYTIKVNSTWDNTIPGENSQTLTVVQLPSGITINAIPRVQGFGQNVTLTADVTDPSSQVGNVFVEVKPYGEAARNYSMALHADGLWKYNFTDFTNGTYAFRAYSNSSGLLENSTNSTFDMFVNLTILIRTLRDTYSVNQLVNLTDPPGMEEPAAENDYEPSIGIASGAFGNYNSLLLILLLSILLNISIIGFSVSQKGSVNIPLLVIINLLLLIPIIYAFGDSSNGYEVIIGNTPYASAHDVNGSGYNLSFQLNAEAYGRANSSNLNATLGQIYITKGTIVQPLTTQFDGDTTDFGGQPNLESVCNAVFENSTAGKIEYRNCVNAEGIDMDSNIFIRKNYAEVRSRNLHSTFNKSANITFIGLSHLGYPKILKDGIDCEDCAILSWSSDTGIAVFNVSSFSNYTAAEANQSKIQNNGTTNASVYLLAKVQFYNASGKNWVDTTTMINDSSPRTLYSNGTLLKLDSLFNGRWNTSANATFGAGTYRVFAAATDENDIILRNFDGRNITVSYNFTIDFGKPGINFTGPTPRNNSRAIGNVHIINASVFMQGSSIIGSCTLEVNNGTKEVNNGTIPAQNFTMEIVGSACNVTIRTFDGFNYTLRAYVNDTTGNENVTLNHTFRENTRPEIPTQIKPLNASGITSDLTLLNYTTFDNDSDVAEYIVYFDTNANPTTQVYRGPSSTFVVNTVAASIYYWKVQADDSYENSSNSSVFQLTKNTAPPIPLVITPNVTGIKLMGGQTYNISWDNATSDANGDNISIAIFYSTDSGLTFPNLVASGLVHSGSYLWTVPSINTDKARIKVTANDSIEFTSDTSDNDFVIDSTPPVITLDEPVNGSSFNNGTFINLTITDLLAGVSNVSWNNNSYPNSPNRTDFNGTYDINTTDWPVGIFNISVYANDTVGNFISAYYTFTVTNIRPVVSFNAPSANQEIRGTFRVNVSSTEFIDDAPFVNFTYPGATQNFTMTQAGTDYFYDLDTTPLSDGQRMLSVYGNDTLGRVVVADRYAIIDNTAPSIRLDTPENNSFKNASPSFTFTPNDANTLASCSLIVNNTVNRTSSSILKGLTNNFSNIAFGSGVHSWTVNCTDGAGNVGTNNTLRILNIDLIRPTITLVDPPNESVVKINRTINFTVTDTGGAGVGNVTWSNNYVVDVQTLIDSYAINTSEFPEGLTNITIRVNDTAGNIQRLLLTYTFDATPPIAEFNKPGALQIIRGNFTVNVTATDTLSNVSGLLFAFNGSANSSMTRASPTITSDYTFDWNTTNASNNQHVLKIFGNDSANNIKFESRFAITDNMAPEIQIDGPANATRSITSLNTFTFTPYEFHALSSCTLLINGTVNATSASMTANASNSLSTTLADGFYRWDVGCNDTAVDNFGIHNTGYNNSNYTISVDTVLPVFNASVNTTVPGHKHVVNISANGSDANGLSFGQIIVNDTGLRKIYNFSLNNAEEAGFSQNVTIDCFGGCVINFSARVNDSHNNFRSNDTILSVIDDLRPVVNTSINRSTVLFGNMINLTANVTDEVGLVFGQIITNITGVKVYYNSTLSGFAAQISQNFSISVVRGNVINFSAVVNDTSGNYRTNDTIITVADYVANVSIGINNTAPRVNEVVNVSSNATDSDNLAFCLIKTNQTGAFANNTFALSGFNGFCSDPIIITATRGNVVNFTVEINDTVGGIIYQNSTKITVANTAPGNATILLPANNLYTNLQSLELNVTFARDADNDAMTINYYINGKLNGSTAFNTTFNASDGYYILNVSLTDGFAHSENVTVNFTIDTIKPIVNTSLNRSMTGIMLGDMINLTANITDEIGLSAGQLAENISGIKRFYNFTLSGTTAQISQNFSISIGRGNVINFSAVVNDTAGNYRTNDTIVTLANTVPGVPTIIFPTSDIYTNLQPLGLNVTFANDADGDALTARYYINGILNQSSSSNTTLNASDGYYILNVSITDGTDSSSNSSVNFTIDTIAPAAFNLTSPANGTSSTDLSPDFTWQNVTEANFVNYTLQVSTGSGFDAISYTASSTVKNETTASVTLTAGQTWYWRVISFDRAQNNFTSAYFVYTTQTAATPSSDTGGTGGGGGGGSSGGGGGGGLILSREKDYSVSPGSIKAKLALGESTEKTLTITNTGDLGLTVSIEIEGVEDFLFVQDNLISLDAGESEEIALNFIGKEIGSFTGRILTSADDIEIEIPIILEVISEKVLFDAKIDIPSAYDIVRPGGELKSQITLLNVGAPEKVDVFVTYFIKDLMGNTVYEETETFAVETQSSFTKSFKIPEGLEEGKYVAIMEVRYADSFAVSSQLFEVQETRGIIEKVVAKNTLVTFAMLFILVGFTIIMLLTKLPKKKIMPEKKRSQKR